MPSSSTFTNIHTLWFYYKSVKAARPDDAAVWGKQWTSALRLSLNCTGHLASYARGSDIFSSHAMLISGIRFSLLQQITEQQAIPRRAFQKNLNMDNIEEKLLSLGLGGMTSNFQQIVKRAFDSRFMPDSLARTMDFKHVKGMVLYGPPGTGKTLVARTMAKIFDATVKVVNGPDIFNKYVGESERNVREIFGEAIEDHFKQGLGILLSSLSLDVGLSCLFEYPEETNSLAVQARGTSFGDCTGDRVVSQLLTMIDGFTELNNIFIIGTTNRLDLVDPAMLRPGRLELQLKVDLPDGNARLQILEIHCKKIRQKDRLSPDINLQDIASRTIGWSGAQLEAACKGALSIAIARSASDGLQFIREEDIKVLQSDFDLMIGEIDPAISKSVLQDLNKLSEKVVEGLEAFAEVEKGIELLLKGNSMLTTCLLAGPPGSGKTTTAALMALKAKVQHVNMISLDPFQKLSEEEQCMKIVQIFENARTFQQSLIIVDDIEVLLKYNSVIPYCSNNILQTLTHQLRIIPSKATKLLVIGTTSEKELLGKVGIADQFFIQIKIRSLRARDARKILQHLTILQESDLDVVVERLDHIPIKKLYRLVDLASAAIVENTNGRKEIELSSLLECMKFVHANLIQGGGTVRPLSIAASVFNLAFFVKLFATCIIVQKSLAAMSQTEYTGLRKENANFKVLS
ncbi:hypothetical protein RJ639_020937 [Escallonia herrerae]|uniref:Vesicle-fusing ATPase n=1 Tax=Escallonia herrerae TaxID=1293975 RepID=A0AA88V2B1_9ASTE|nr:hypothetical protein RJ639_020937 [Escallonia herrerae]